MSAKIFSVRSLIILVAMALVIAGCTPAGPRALLKGKKYLEAGENAAAVAQLKIATSLLATNAAAWNYYGVALQRAGQPDEAILAYNRAVELDRELLEARLNLGTLYMELNQADSAKAQFTAYTLRRPNDPAGWIKLGAAQLKLGEIVPAERSFSAVLSLKTSEAEAYNGLGLARVQRGKPREAAQFFAAALQTQPDFAPALLNIGIVSQQQLHDNKAALEYFQRYLALTPRPANWEDVNALVKTIQQIPATPVTVAAATPPPAATPSPVKPVAVQPVPEPKPQPKPVVQAPKLNLSPRAQSEVKPPISAPASAPGSSAQQVVQVAPEPQIVATPGAAKPVAPPTEEQKSKPGFFSKIFGGGTSVTAATTNSSYLAGGVTPLPGTPTAAVSPVMVKTAPATAPKQTHVFIAPSPVNFPRYAYANSRPPQPGDRRAASAAFTEAQQAEKELKPAEELAAYKKAAQLDPSWFEAQYNAALLAQRQGDNAAALSGFEKAVAIKPGSADARYFFALALNAANYAPDAAAELNKVLASNPGEVRAHLLLANICAQRLRDPVQARAHYQKVLELDPKNPRTADILRWLAANPG